MREHREHLSRQLRFWEPTIFLVSEVSAVRFGKEFTTGTPPVQKGCGQGCVGLAVVGKHSTLWGEKLCKRRGGKDKKNVRILLQETFQGGVFFSTKKIPTFVSGYGEVRTGCHYPFRAFFGRRSSHFENKTH